MSTPQEAPEIPTRGIRHIRFNIGLGDRAVPTREEALKIAIERAPSRGRQQVSRLKTNRAGAKFWRVQDIR